MNTCRQIPLQVNFEEKTTFRVWCLYSYLVHDVQYLFDIGWYAKHEKIYFWLVFSTIQEA
jgi:hypothetical protein